MFDIELELQDSFEIEDLEIGIEKVYPRLEDLEVTPTSKKQEFIHEGSYGYDKVIVNAVSLQDKTVEPTKEQQVIVSDEGYSGLNQVTVSGDDNLIPGNIRKGTSIFGVEGEVVSSNITDFFNGTITEGTMNVGGWEKIIKKLPPISIEGTSARYMLAYFNGETLDVTNLDTSQVTDMYGMFRNSKYKTLDLRHLNISNVTIMNMMFYNCTNLIDLNMDNLDASKVADVEIMFSSASQLKNLVFMKNLGAGYSIERSENYNLYTLNLSNCSQLTHDSLMSVINNIYDIKTKGCNPQRLSLGAANLAKLTEEEVAIATNKGWNVT